MEEQLNILAKTIKEGKLIFFFGAGASKSANLPLGFEIIDWFLKNLITNKELYDKIKDSNYKLRFEKTISLTAEIIQEDALKLLDVFTLSTPTLAHYFIAECARVGLQCCHITTNFDDLLEKAFIEKKLNLNSLYSIAQYKKESHDGFNNYLLHGTTLKDGIEPAEIITTIDTVLQPLNYYKERILISTITNKTIVFVGYSAWDHDIFPILKAQSQNTEYWFVSPEKFGKNLRIVELLNGDQSKYISTTSDELFLQLFKKVFPNVKLETLDKPTFESIENDFKKQLDYIIPLDRAKIISRLLTFIGLTEDASTINSSYIKSKDFNYWLQQEADILYQSGKWEKLKPLIENNIKELKNSQSFKASEYSTLARILLNSNFYNEAENYARIGFSESIKKRNNLDVAISGLALGNVLLFRGRHNEAYLPFNKALKSCEEYPERAASIKMALGVLNYRAGKIEKAEKQYKEALKIFEEATDKFSIAKCKLNLAELYRHNKDKLELAFRCINDAKELAHENNYLAVLHNLASIEMLALKLDDRLDEAVMIGLQAINRMKISSQKGETYANTLSDTGLIYCALEKYDDALLLFKEALEIFLSIEHYYRIPLLYSNIAEALIKKEDYTNAEKQIEIAKTYFDKFGDEDSGLEVTLWVLSCECKLLLLKGDYKLCKNKIEKGIINSSKINDSELINEFQELKNELTSAANIV